MITGFSLIMWLFAEAFWLSFRPNSETPRSDESSLTMRIHRDHERRIAKSLVQGTGIRVWPEPNRLVKDAKRLMDGQRKVRSAYMNQNEKLDPLGQEIGAILFVGRQS